MSVCGGGLAVVLWPQLTHALFSRWQCFPPPGGACSCLSWDPLCLPLLPLALHFNLALATGKPSRTGRRWSRRCCAHPNDPMAPGDMESPRPRGQCVSRSCRCRRAAPQEQTPGLS